MRTTKVLLPLSIALLVSSLLFVLPAQNSEVLYDKLMSEAFAADGPGATVLVGKDGKIVYKKAFGMANLELGIPMKPDNVFEIGSVTKQFTAVSILKLTEEGKLNLDDDITKFIEDYPTHGHKITVHHLLTHTSGIKSYTGIEEFQKIWRLDHSPTELIDVFKNKPMDFAPGEEWSYNNSAYFLLGYIIELTSGMTYEEYLDKNIFQPLGMKNSYYGSMSRIIKNRATGYDKKDDYVHAEYLSLTLPYAAGSIMSTVEDLFIWQMALQAGKVIKKESLDLAYTNYTLNNGKLINYGYGWGINEIFGSPSKEHSGGIFGYLSNGIYLPQEDVYVAVLSNCNCNPPMAVSTQIAAIAIGKPYPDKDAGIKLKETELKNLVGMYEFDDGSNRNIVFEDGQLFSVRQGSRSEIYPSSKEKFFFNESTASYVFSFDSKGEPTSVYFENRIDKAKGKRVSKEIKEKESIHVEPTVLKQYVGTYEVQPGFDLVVTVEGEQLMTQATGQQKFQLHAESETKFFLKEVDAALEFKKGASGEYDSAVLYQGGREIVAKRKN